MLNCLFLRHLLATGIRNLIINLSDIFLGGISFCKFYDNTDVLIMFCR